MAFTGTDRFELLGRLGAGGMGVVYEAYDRARGMRVALKTLRRVSATHLLRFKREFRALRELGHPNIITLYELIAEGKQWLFTMELIHGQDMVSYIRRGAASEGSQSTSLPGTPAGVVIDDSVDGLHLPRTSEIDMEALLGGDTSVDASWSDASMQRGLTTAPELGGDTAVTQTLSDSAVAWQAIGVAAAGPSGQRRHVAERIDLDALRDVCAQLAGALHTLHGAGMIHRDLKPSNVMVTREGRVVLMDFGIVADTRQPRALTVAGSIQGTPAFMAPEQVRGEPLTAAADWYAFGVILYTLLAGRLPYDGGRAQVLFGKQVLDALPPSRFTAGIPDELEHLCMRLLAREPGDRPGSREVLATLGVTLGARPATAVEAGRELFVGRACELAELEQLYREACAGTMRCGLIEAPSGMGKSRLAERFLADLAELGHMADPDSASETGAEDGPVILAGRCHERESLPYKAFDGVMDLLSQYLADLPDEVRRACLPGAIYLLARIFPVLRRLPECDMTVTFGGDPRPLRMQALRALRSLLAELGRIRPVVVYIDDVEWIDRDSVELLTGLMQAPVPGRLLLLLCARQEAGQSGEHAALDDLRAAMAGHEICRRIELGPLLPDEQQSLVDALGARLGRRRMDDAVWRDSAGHPLLMAELARYVRADGNTTSEAPGLYDILWRRVARLSEAERALLTAVACLDEPAPLRVIADAAGLSYTDRERALTLLVTGQLVRITRAGHEPWLDIYHAVLREAVLARLGSEAARDLHREIARSLEGWSDASPALRARHWQAAGEHDRAVQCLLAAARSAAAQLAFDRADELYRQALALLGDILDSQGEANGEARAGETSAGETSAGETSAGETSAGETSAGEAGEDGPASARSRAHPERALRRCQAQAWIGLAEGLRLADRPHEALALLDRAHAVASAHDFVSELADIHYLRGNLLFARGDIHGCLAEQTHARALARRAGLPLREARAASGLGHAYYMRGHMISAQSHYDHCLELGRAHGFDDVIASNLSMRGLTRFYQNDLQTALQNGEEAAALAARVGHRRAELNALCHCAGLVWAELGHAERAHQVFARAIELSRELGALRFEASSWLFLGKLLAMQGRHDEALPLIERSLAHSRQIGMAYVGPIVLGALALVTTDAAVREQALAEAEHILRTGVSSHNYLYFYRDAMEVSLAMGDHERLARYALALERFTAAEPLPWSDFFIARARLLAAHGRGRHDPETLGSIEALYRRGREAGYHFATAALDLALAAGPGTLRGY